METQVIKTIQVTHFLNFFFSVINSRKINFLNMIPFYLERRMDYIGLSKVLAENCFYKEIIII